MKGLFIDICGLDGSGKSTQASMLKEHFASEYGSINTELIHGFKPAIFSKELKEIAVTFERSYEELYSPPIKSMSFLMDLLINAIDVITPKLKNGDIIITEKYVLDSLIYLPLLGTREEFVLAIKSIIPMPDISIYLDLDETIAYNRVLSRANQEGKIIAPKESLNIMRDARQSFIKKVESGDIDFCLCGEEKMENIHNSILKIVAEYIQKHKLELKIRI